MSSRFSLAKVTSPCTTSCTTVSPLCAAFSRITNGASLARARAPRALLPPHLFELGLGRIAAIGLALRQQLLGNLAVPPGAGELIDGLAVPIEAAPAHPLQNGGDGFRR